MKTLNKVIAMLRMAEEVMAKRGFVREAAGVAIARVALQDSAKEIMEEVRNEDKD